MHARATPCGRASISMYHRMVLFLDLVRLRADFSQRLTLLPRLHTWPGFAPTPDHHLAIVPSKRATISTFEFIALSPDLVLLRPDFAWQKRSWCAQAQHFAPGPPVGTPEGLIFDLRGAPDGSFSIPEELPGPPQGPPDFGASDEHPFTQARGRLSPCLCIKVTPPPLRAGAPTA